MAIRKSELQQKIQRAPPKATPVETPSSDPSPFSRPADPAPAREQIELAAYYRAAARGFAPGQEVEDWLAAERELSERGSGTANG
jgi:Protein of unknown function (DUF2934)